MFTSHSSSMWALRPTLRHLSAKLVIKSLSHSYITLIYHKLRTFLSKIIWCNLTIFAYICVVYNTFKREHIMNKAELINAIASESGLSKTDSKKALDAFITSVTKSLKNGEKVTLVGFGTFRVGQRSEKAGYDPANKTAITIPARRVPRFKAGTELLDAVE